MAGAGDDVGAGAEIEVRDERGEAGPGAWIGSISRQLERFQQDQLPFAVLLVELGDAERLRRAALPAAMSSLTGRIERTLAQELQRVGGHPAQRRGRPAGELMCERPGRYWLLAPETDAIAAGRLAEWISYTIGGLADGRWAPLEVMVGVAVCPEDGREAAALAAHADLALYARRPAVR
jgi:GGDEF domain-containing protein